MTEKPEGPLRQKQTPNLILKMCAWWKIIKSLFLFHLLCPWKRRTWKWKVESQFQLTNIPSNLRLTSHSVCARKNTVIKSVWCPWQEFTWSKYLKGNNHFNKVNSVKNTEHTPDKKAVLLEVKISSSNISLNCKACIEMQETIKPHPVAHALTCPRSKVTLTSLYFKPIERAGLCHQRSVPSTALVTGWALLGSAALQ